MRKKIVIKDCLGSLLIRAIERSMAHGDKGIFIARTACIGERLFVITCTGDEHGEPDFFRAYEIVLVDSDTVRLGEVNQKEFVKLMDESRDSGNGKEYGA
jgi:hypothetical protein